jgi:hypothetical protein
MALIPEVAVAQIVAALNAVVGGEIATKADLVNAIAPLATQAQMQLQLQEMQVQIIAQMHALLAPHNAPAIAAAATATVQSIITARMRNAHDRSDVAYAVVPLANGTLPPHWPVGFNRTALFRGNINQINDLLNDFGLAQPLHTSALNRRNELAVHIGTMRV